jgi:hypothetical protein
MAAEHFRNLGYPPDQDPTDFVLSIVQGNQRYRIVVPERYYREHGPWPNLLTLGYLRRVADWSQELYIQLPELPANLIETYLPLKRPIIIEQVN